MSCRIVWGCDQSRQLEVGWVNFLLSSVPQHMLPRHILVESGLLLLESSPSNNRLLKHCHDRMARLNLLQDQPLTIIHLSDEDGRDGDSFYSLLPEDCIVWRNFHHPRFLDDCRIRSFPIGPRREFLVESNEMSGICCSKRSIPWGFMGTLWSSGSRTLAVSLFLRSIPQGTFYGGKHFGVGIPLDVYRHRLQHTTFALAPEGDRHLDTFRLWESLCCGCIPLVVDYSECANYLFPLDYPGPIFSTWGAALKFAQKYLHDGPFLDKLQAELQYWWSKVRVSLSHDITSGLTN